MSATDSTPLVFFRVLADRACAPAALQLLIGPGEGAALLPLAASEDVAALPTQIPCWYGPGIDPDLAAALAGAGWRELDPATVYTTDDKFAAELMPPDAQWLAGSWILQAPAKQQGTQAASRTLALQLVQLVAADAHTNEIEALLRYDATLSYHLLRLVNSLGMGARRNVNSFAQAILILGRQQLRRWLNLMLFAARQGDPRSPMLLARVAVRSRTLELLARARGLDKNNQEQAFMAGMFSLLGVLFGMTIEEVIAPLPLSDTLRAALLQGEGDIGALLRLVEQAEEGELAACAGKAAAQHIESADFNEAAVAACRWMLDAVRENKGSNNA